MEGEPTPADHIAISALKARYCRFLDEKDWHGYASLFTSDAQLDTTASGGTVTQGREALVASVRQALAEATTVHQVHSPEITMLSPDEAEVIWATQDRIVWDEAKALATGYAGLTGFGHYRERCIKDEEGQWRISRSKLTRLHLEFDRPTVTAAP